MTQWIETDDGYVNLDHVVRVKRRQGGKSGTQAILELVNDTVETIALWGDDLDMVLTADVIPAAPGQEAWLVHLPNSSTERPTDVYMLRQPIIGWRLPRKLYGYGNAVPVPILPGYGNVSSDTEMVAIITASGELFDTMTGQTFDGIAELKAYLLNDAWKLWDREHAAKD
jgi:hypothetical protein